MQDALRQKAQTRSELIAAALGETVGELRLVDAADLIGYIKAEQWANIADLVQSSSELSLKDGVLTFACAADYEVTWGNPPSLSLELEFQHADVMVLFSLALSAEEARIIINSIWFTIKPLDDAYGTSVLAAALNESRRDSAPLRGAT